MAADGTNRRFASLDEALTEFRMPAENRAFVEQYLGLVDPIGYYGRSGYIKVIRRDGGPAIQIHVGYATGFRTESELKLTVADADIWESDRGAGLWGVTHPVGQRGRESAGSRVAGGGRVASPRRAAAGGAAAAAPKPVEREREICMDCFEEKSYSGECSCS